MEVKVVRMRKNGVAISGRALNQEFPAAGTLVILDVTDQGLRRQVKVARLLQGQMARYELVDPHIVWAADGRFTLAGFERQKNQEGAMVDYAQSWLCMLDGPAPGHTGPGRPPRVER